MRGIQYFLYTVILTISASGIARVTPSFSVLKAVPGAIVAHHTPRLNWVDVVVAASPTTVLVSSGLARFNAQFIPVSRLAADGQSRDALYLPESENPYATVLIPIYGPSRGYPGSPIIIGYTARKVVSFVRTSENEAFVVTSDGRAVAIGSHVERDGVSGALIPYFEDNIPVRVKETYAQAMTRFREESTGRGHLKDQAPIDETHLSEKWNLSNLKLMAEIYLRENPDAQVDPDSISVGGISCKSIWQSLTKH